eukprot:364904-Chlamydomonas_euryale.AAC.25
MGGCRVLPGSEPAAHCYAGHQFQMFSGQLGDGAAMYLGEVIDAGGARWELQLKGAGRTPYSRAGDGRKVRRRSESGGGVRLFSSGPCSGPRVGG